jgi:multidrug efflux system membrane fusion protein
MRHRRSSGVKRWITGVLAVAAISVVGGGVTACSGRPAAAAPSDARDGGASGPRATGGADPRSAAANRPVPVVPATVTRRDVPIDLEGLGAVAAYKTVTVRTQIDGRLDQVLFTEGQAVKRGQVLAQIDPRPYRIQLQTAEGALARDQAQLANARLNVTRNQTLVTEKLVAQQSLDDAAALAGQLAGTIIVDQAAIGSARLNLDYTRITSPIEGVTGVRLVDPGNYVRAADVGGLVVVTQLDPIAVLFTLPQDDLPRIVAEMANRKLAVEAYSRDGSILLGAGQLELIDNQINQATATLRLKAILPNPKHVLWPNQFVKARLRLAVKAGALTIPSTALQRGPNGTFVYVILADGTVAVRPIKAAAPRGDLAVIDEGLAEGETVVADGQNQLRPGSKVVVRAPGGPGGEGGRGPRPAGHEGGPGVGAKGARGYGGGAPDASAPAASAPAGPAGPAGGPR